MKIRKLFSLILILLICTYSIALCACSDNDELNSDETEAETIALTLDNYSKYFVLQEEIISYNENPYTKGSFSMMQANQTTKFSVLLLQSNIEFQNVSITIINDTWDGSYNVPGNDKHYIWKGNSGTIMISYNGEGIITLYASYDGYANSMKPMKYSIEKIVGNIIINAK